MKNLKFIPVRRAHLKRLNEIVNDEKVARFLTLTPPVSMKSTENLYAFVRKAHHPW